MVDDADTQASIARSGPDGGTGGGNGVGGANGSGRATDSPWWRVGFPIAMVLLVLAIPTLVWVGSQVLLDSDDGRVLSAITDPDAPGWEAVVDPTPVHALAAADADGELDHVVLQFRTGATNGGVVVVPADTVFTTKAYGDIALSRIFDDGGGAEGEGAEAIRGAVQSIVGIGIDDMQLVTYDQWGSLVAPIAPFTINNPDDVTGTDAQGQPVSFPKGSIEVDADEVWPYLHAQNPEEDAINRAIRIEAFWRGWLGAVNAAGDTPESVPGEIDSGLGSFVRSLALGATQVVTLPVAPTIGPAGEAWFAPQENEVQALIASLDPFPAGPLGERLRLRVLDGTGELDHGLAAAKTLGANGGQIDKVGNALDFDRATTELVFYDPALRPQVQALRDALGVGELVQSEELNVNEDVTVLLGQDYLALVGSSASSSTAAGITSTESTDG